MPRDRACPRDHVPLVERKVGATTIDECPTCRGVFLDKNELARLTGDRDVNAFLRDKLAGAPDSHLVCPACGGLMLVEAPDGVEVDVCVQCFGIWLDAGELEGLRAREAGEVPITPEKRSALTDAELAEWRRHSAAGPFAKLTRGLSELARRHL